MDVLYDRIVSLWSKRAARAVDGIHDGPRTFLRLPKTVLSLFYGKITGRDRESRNARGMNKQSRVRRSGAKR